MSTARTLRSLAAAAAAAAILGGTATAATAGHGLPSRAAQQARGRHRPLLCDQRGHGLCLTVPPHGDWLRAGAGDPVRITAAGRVRARGRTFRRSPWLNGIFAGHRLVRIRLGGKCAAGDVHARVVLRPCTRRVLWVRDGRYWASVRASDARGLPAYLAAGGAGPARVYAFTLNGYVIGRQEWRVVTSG